MHVSLTDAGPGDPTLIVFPKRLRVLVVEDDFGDFDAVARALRKVRGFELSVTRAKTIEAARKVMADMRFDVYLVDYNLGAESGARFLKEIGGRGGHGVPILLTGLYDSDVHEISLRAGAIICINKSDLSPTLLETTLRCALYTHRLEKELSDLLRSISTAADGKAIAAGLQAIAVRMPWLARDRRAALA